MDDKEIIKEEKKNELRKNSFVLLMALKRHKVSLLIILFLFLVSSSFAWFIYNETVDLSLHARVKSWNIELGDENNTDDEYVIKIAALYPGMVSIDTSVSGEGIPITNNGELSAAISINIESITLFGVEQIRDTDYTLDVSNDGKIFTVSGYPFVLSFVLDASQINSGGVSSLNYSLVWDFDNSDPSCMLDDDGNAITYNRCDVEDTEMGERSYEYSKDHPTESSLIVKMKMDVTQVN